MHGHSAALSGNMTYILCAWSYCVAFFGIAHLNINKLQFNT